MSNFPPSMTYPHVTILAHLYKLNENRILIEMVFEFILEFHFNHSTKFFTEMVLQLSLSCQIISTVKFYQCCHQFEG